jgi:hypothetical protein
MRWRSLLRRSWVIVLAVAPMSSTIDQGALAAEIKLTGEYSMNRSDENGTSTKRLIPASRSMCYLTGITFVGIGGPAEFGACRIITRNGYWELAVRLGNTRDADAYCFARCVQW